VSLAGFASNLLIVPLVGLLTMTGVGLYIAHFIAAGLAAAFAYASHLLLALILGLVHFFAGTPAAVAHVAAPSLLFVAGCYFFLWMVVRTPVSVMSRWSTLGLLLIGAGTYLVAGNRASRTTVVTFLHAGSGDAIHLTLPGGRHWLVDGGGSYESRADTGERIVGPYLWSHGVRVLDKVILTHPHLPHYGGLQYVIENFPVREVIFNPDLSREPEFRDLLETIERKGIPWREAWAGDILSSGTVTVTALAPRTLYDDKDNNSLVLRLAYGGRTILLTGDMKSEEADDVLAGPLSRADILQLPAHGRARCCHMLVARLRPVYAVVSGQVTPAEVHCRIFSTEESGAVSFAITASGRILVGEYRDAPGGSRQ
jgi:competence protein ComEC